MLSRLFLNNKPQVLSRSYKYFSTSHAHFKKHACKLLVVGGGSGGCAVAAKFARELNKGEIIIVEPSDNHYYQAMFTMVGGGIKKLEESRRNTKDVLPKNATWIKDSVVEFQPEQNYVTLANGDTVLYDLMLIAVGLQLHFEAIPGLVEELNNPRSGVCSNYSPSYASKTYECMKNFESGNAIFTFPNTPVKCAGAPQKIAYLTEHYFRKTEKRDKAKIIYNTSLPVLFTVKKYADALWKVVKARDIEVNLCTNLIEIVPDKKTAVFQNLDKPDETNSLEYSMLHVTPPMGAPDVLKNCPELVTGVGFVNVDSNTFQHVKYPNVFAIGDCSSVPTSKTAAACAAQCLVVYQNIKATMKGKDLKGNYDGYTSCPLVTGYGTCILAEFDYNLNPVETFPMRQDKELWSMYKMKKDLMPALYWNLFLTGYWNGPAPFRRLFHLGDLIK